MGLGNITMEIRIHNELILQLPYHVAAFPYKAWRHLSNGLFNLSAMATHPSENLRHMQIILTSYYLSRYCQCRWILHPSRGKNGNTYSVQAQHLTMARARPAKSSSMVDMAMSTELLGRPRKIIKVTWLSHQPVASTMDHSFPSCYIHCLCPQ
jgi:hypothetical protein